MYKVANCLKDINLCEVGMCQLLDWSELDASARDELCDLGYDEDTPVDMYVIDRLQLWNIAGDYIYDDDFILQELEGIIKKAPYYLVMAHNCRWNGASGYMIVSDIKDAFRREYDCSIYPVSVSKGGKCLICRESSHDVPMGARTSIIALTKKEYRMLDDQGWESVEKFVERCERRVS